MRGRILAALLTSSTLGLAGCAGQVTYHGYVASEEALEQIQIGSSKEQVELVMGTPSTSASIGKEVYYYISETRSETLFFAPKTTDRRVLAFYFDHDSRVERIANYGLQDGKVFDFISRTTPTHGESDTALKRLLGSLLSNVGPSYTPAR